MYLSYSQIFLFKECARLWQASYRQGKRQQGDENLTFGSAIHKAVEARVAGRAPDIAKFWADNWGEFTKSPGVTWNISPEEAYAMGLRVLTSEGVLPILDRVRPMVVDGRPTIERKVEWTLDKGMPPIIGYIDCIEDDGVPMDFKTSAQMWTRGRAKAELQPLFYLAALDAVGETQHAYRFRHLVMTKGPYPVAQIFETQRSAEEVEGMKAMVREVWAKISAGEFEANPKSWLCTTACPVWEECPPGQERWAGTPPGE